MLLTFIVSLVETFGGIGIKVPLLFNGLEYLPLSDNRFAWLVPAILGFVAGGLLYRKKSSQHELNDAFEDREKE
ncbi:branched-chain amino acid transport system II carrier protein [Rummeliibacillus sp. BSL5]